MSRYDPIDEKDDVPSLAEQYYVGLHKVGQNRGNAPDNVNGRLPLEPSDLEAIGAKPEDKIWLTVKGNSQTVETDSPQTIYRAGDGVTLTSPKRRELQLSPGDTVKYWIYPAEITRESEGELEGANQAGQEPNRQGSLSDSMSGIAGKNENATKRDEGAASDTNDVVNNSGNMAGTDDTEELVWVVDNNPRLYHRTHPSKTNETICGIEYPSHDHELIDNSGHLSECPECSFRPSESLTNIELIESIGDRVGFEINGDTRGNYLKRKQWIKIRDYVYSGSENTDLETASG